jgi:uncharacterized membrane protein
LHAFLHAILAIAHTLAAAAWVGAMFYSLTVLHPRARQFFQSPEQFEEFIATVSRGARWKVVSALAFIAATGLFLLPLTWRPASPAWLLLIAAKSLALLAATAVFYHASWRLWPRRIFATPSELPAIHRSFRRVAITLILLAELAIALGVLAHVLSR